MPIYHHTNPAIPPVVNHYFSGANGQYFDAQSLARIVETFVSSHPDLVEVIDLPNKTYGYDGAATVAFDGEAVSSARVQMKLYRIHGVNDCALHGIFIYGSPHAREWVPKHALVEVIYRLLKNYGTDDYLTALLDEVDVFYVPDVNPDGSMYSFHDVASFRRNRHVSGGAPELWTCTSDNSCKVDINRNYSVGFGSGSSSSSCADETYHGVCKLSEPESRNVSWVVKQYPKIWTSISAHSAGNQIFWPVAPDGVIPQLDSANAKSQSPDEILGGTSLQRSGWFNYMAQRCRAAIYDHRGTILDQAGFTPGPTPSHPFGSGISTYEMYFNHTDNPLTDRYKTVKSSQWFEHPHKVYQYTFEMSSVGVQPSWPEADELIMEWANGVLEVIACTRDLSQQQVFGLTPIASEHWLQGTFNDNQRARAWGSDWLVSGDVEMLTDFYCHSGSHSIRMMATGRVERRVDLRGVLGARLSFAWRAASWEAGDYVYVKVNDGSGWQTVKRFVNGDDDYFYHMAEVDLSAFAGVEDFAIAFEGAMSSTSDWFYLDYIELRGYRALAFDDFNSNSFAGGQGWLTPWQVSSSASMDSDYPLEGGYCCKLLQDGKISRQIDLTGVVGAKLMFDSRSVYFEAGDEAYVEVEHGGTITRLLTLNKQHCDKVYHQHVLDLQPFVSDGVVSIHFVGGMNASTDYWYIDRVRVLGERALAFDDFASKDFTGGDGFSAGWQNNNAQITLTEQFAGKAAALLTLNASLSCVVNLTNATDKRLQCMVCVDDSLIFGDEFVIRVNDGGTWVVVKTLTDADADGYYHGVDIDLSGFSSLGVLEVEFAVNLQHADSFVALDEVKFV